MTGSTINQTPEQIARDRIDERLRASGWAVQPAAAINHAAAPGVAVREYQTTVGPADYALFGDRRPLGVVEAKPDAWGEKITIVEQQSAGYATAQLKWVKNPEPLPFIYEATGEITRFTDGRDPKPRSREVFTFHQPSTLVEWAGQPRSFRAALQDLPPLKPDGLRDCQITAITNLENSLRQDRPRALVQMATGSGKTFTAITQVYRLLKHAGARRVLFLVDTKNLGEQAEQEFMAYVPNDDSRKFTELYTVQRLSSSYISPQAQVIICTIQRMYSILKGEALPEGAEDEHPAERMATRREPLPVAYNPDVPPEFFDVVIIDECHLFIYNLWRQVIEYFDSFLVGLTATPDARTYGFFQKNVVSEYTHEKAVADGVNVGNEVYLIETRISQQGGKIAAEQMVEKRERQTRAKRWERQDNEEDFTAKQLDRSVVVPDQIRTVIRAFRDKLPEIFPGRTEVPKTLIFAKTDSHADDIIQIVRAEFGESNDFCRKITHQADNPKSVLSDFRNAYSPRIAVTVDMIATGTDVKPLECLLFLRDVKSANYFEQMKGRGTRVVKADDLKKVTPSASAKTHYVIVDAVGVTRSDKTASQPLDTKPSIPFKDLAMGVMMGATDEDTVASLAARLARLDRQLGPEEQARIAEKAGRPLRTITRDLFDAIDADRVETLARQTTGQDDPDDPALDAAQDKLVTDAARVLTGELITLLDTIRRDHEQTVAHEVLDQVENTGWAGDVTQNAKTIAADFEGWLTEHRDRIAALTIYFTQPARRSQVTYQMIKDTLAALKSDRPRLAPAHVWRAYAHLDDYKGEAPISELTQLVALIRRVAGLDATLTPNEDRVRRNFQAWVLRRHSGAGENFTDALIAPPAETFDYVRANPPFGKKSSTTFTTDEGEADGDLTYNRQDFWATTSNKQLNFVQHIRAMLKTTGRAAVVVPDNVLFDGGACEIIRRKLLQTCDLHTILRLPTGIFYAQGVKANVIFFDNRPASKDPQTREVWYYDYQTNVHDTLKKKPLRYDDLAEFVRLYNPANRYDRTPTWSDAGSDGRWRAFSREELLARDKASLDLFWLKDKSLTDLDNLPEPDDLAEEIIEGLEAGLSSLRAVLRELRG